MRNSAWAALAAGLLAGGWAFAADAKRVALITGPFLPAPAQYGLERLERSLRRILVWLARSYAHRLHAGVSYCLFQETGGLFSLDDAIAREKQAAPAWERIVAAAGDVYRDDLAFGVERVGFPRHWKQELPRLTAGVRALEKLRRQGQAEAAPGESAHGPLRQAARGSWAPVGATAASASSAVVHIEGATI